MIRVARDFVAITEAAAMWALKPSPPTTRMWDKRQDGRRNPSMSA